ncbi:hypothetical protein PspCFBP13528_03725 [Pseudomonas sp. CFBP13528]|nr:hypothetical protein PspCFBP13528_03725 [Pseudomonas sp. CFBP13528]
MLAKNVNDNAGSLALSAALRFFASKLAPTKERQKAAIVVFRVPRLCLAEGLCHDDPTAG